MDNNMTTLNPLEGTLQELFECFVRRVEIEKLSKYINSNEPESIKEEFRRSIEQLLYGFVNNIDWEKVVSEAEIFYAREACLTRFVKQKVNRYKQVNINTGGVDIESFLRDEFKHWMQHQVAGWAHGDIDWSAVAEEFEGIFPKTAPAEQKTMETS